MREDLNSSHSSKAEWENLTNAIAEQGQKGTPLQLPFAYFSSEISLEANSDDLYQVYRSLLQKAANAIQDTNVVYTQHGTPYSYNLAMTTSAMILCPRRCEASSVLGNPWPHPQNPVHVEDWKYGSIALNGTLLAGTLMVKDKKVFEYLQSKEAFYLDRVLRVVAFPFELAKEAHEAEESDATKL